MPAASTRKVFAEGQLYVGLSRVRSAAGLTVFPKIEPNRLIASREVVEFYDSLEHRMEEPVQIECPRRYESRVRAYVRDLMDGRDPDAPTPPALEGALENSKGRYPGTGDRKAGSNPRGEDWVGYSCPCHLRPQICSFGCHVQGPS